MISNKDTEHPFFRPLWRRIAVVAFCAAWAAWELYSRDMFWAIIVGALAIYAGWRFLFNFDHGKSDSTSSNEEERS